MAGLALAMMVDDDDLVWRVVDVIAGSSMDGLVVSYLSVDSVCMGVRAGIMNGCNAAACGMGKGRGQGRWLKNYMESPTFLPIGTLIWPD